MISEARKAAARANGAKSRGPKTLEGKRISARNSLRHGRYARTICWPGDPLEPFFHRLCALYAEFRRLRLSPFLTLNDLSLRLSLLEVEMLDAESDRLAPQYPSLAPMALASRALTEIVRRTRLLPLLRRLEGHLAAAIAHSHESFAERTQAAPVETFKLLVLTASAAPAETQSNRLSPSQPRKPIGVVSVKTLCTGGPPKPP